MHTISPISKYIFCHEVGVKEANNLNFTKQQIGDGIGFVQDPDLRHGPPLLCRRIASLACGAARKAAGTGGGLVEHETDRVESV
jgi:hypothetical protein